MAKPVLDIKSQPGFKTVALLCLAILYIPILILIVFAFNAGNLVMSWEGFSFKWFSVALANQEFRNAAKNTLMISSVATVAATSFATLAAIGMARDSFAQKDFAAVIDIAAQIIEIEPSQAEAYALKARAEIELQQLEAATATLMAVPVEKQNDANIISARAALDLALNPVDTSELTRLSALIAKTPDDFAARIEMAVILNGSNQRLEAIDQLIYVIRKDRSWNEQAARKQLVSFFEAWGPKDEATLVGRRKLSSVLFS